MRTNLNWLWPAVILCLGLPIAAASEALSFWNGRPIDPNQPWVSVRVTAMRGAPEIDDFMHVSGHTDRGVEELARLDQVLRTEEDDETLDAHLSIDRRISSDHDAPARFTFRPGGRYQVGSMPGCDELDPA